MNPNNAPWQEYPRPQLRRDSYLNLNGLWDFAVTTEAAPQIYDREILVPFCPESSLSGISAHFAEGSGLWYRRSFRLPEGFHRGRVLLHIGAADQRAWVYVNGLLLASHEGGYDHFTVDITAALQPEDNQLEICCKDDLRDETMPYGKQTLKPGGMWYTPVSGIWQTVWLESVPEQAIDDITIRTTLQEARIQVQPPMDGTVHCQGKTYPLVQGQAVIAPEEPRLWSPEDPWLYDFTIQAGEDLVSSYFALRTTTVEDHGGKPRLCLNGKPYFFHGLLDQGYWSDGLLTPESPECFTRDILQMKELGFNTLRKHIKVEPDAFYYRCDKLGMVVFQDMVNNGHYRFFRDTALPTIGILKIKENRRNSCNKSRRAFERAMERTVQQLKNHPSILYWTIFNEGWGQTAPDRMYEKLRALDPDRWIDTCSGWFVPKKSHVVSRHIYYGSWRMAPEPGKPLVLSEYGGHCYAVPGHVFDPDKSYGYKTCKTPQALQESIAQLVRQKLLPAIRRDGLCAAIYTQVSDVEEEINGLLTYDRAILKPDIPTMQALAQELQEAFRESLNP